MLRRGRFFAPVAHFHVPDLARALPVAPEPQVVVVSDGKTDPEPAMN